MKTTFFYFLATLAFVIAFLEKANAQKNEFNTIEVLDETRPALKPTSVNAHSGKNLGEKEIQEAHTLGVDSYIPIPVQETVASNKLYTLLGNYGPQIGEDFESTEQIVAWVDSKSDLGSESKKWNEKLFKYLVSGNHPELHILSIGYLPTKTDKIDVGPKWIERHLYVLGQHDYTEDEATLDLDLGRLFPSVPEFQGVFIPWISKGCANHILPFEPVALKKVEAPIARRDPIVNPKPRQRFMDTGWQMQTSIIESCTTCWYDPTPPQNFQYCGQTYQNFGCGGCGCCNICGFNNCNGGGMAFSASIGWGWGNCGWNNNGGGSCGNGFQPAYQDPYQGSTIINEGDFYEGDTILNEGDVINNFIDDEDEDETPPPPPGGGPNVGPNGSGVPPLPLVDGRPIVGDNDQGLGLETSNGVVGVNRSTLADLFGKDELADLEAKVLPQQQFVTETLAAERTVVETPFKTKAVTTTKSTFDRDAFLANREEKIKSQNLGEWGNKVKTTVSPATPTKVETIASATKTSLENYKPVTTSTSTATAVGKESFQVETKPVKLASYEHKPTQNDNSRYSGGNTALYGNGGETFSRYNNDSALQNQSLSQKNPSGSFIPKAPYRQNSGNNYRQSQGFSSRYNNGGGNMGRQNNGGGKTFTPSSGGGGRKQISGGSSQRGR